MQLRPLRTFDVFNKETCGLLCKKQKMYFDLETLVKIAELDYSCCVKLRNRSATIA